MSARLLQFHDGAARRLFQLAYCGSHVKLFGMCYYWGCAGPDSRCILPPDDRYRAYMMSHSDGCLNPQTPSHRSPTQLQSSFEMLGLLNSLCGRCVTRSQQRFRYFVSTLPIFAYSMAPSSGLSCLSSNTQHISIGILVATLPTEQPLLCRCCRP